MPIEMKKYYILFLLMTCLGTRAAAAETPADFDALAPEMSEVAAPLTETAADIEAPDLDEELNPIAISVNGTQVHVVNAAGKVLEIYNLAGVRVASFKLDSDDKTVNINLNKGCYILKVDKVVRKVSIK